MYDTRNDIKDERIITHNLYLGKFKKLTYNKLNEMEKNLAMLVCNDEHMMKELAKGSKLRGEIMSDYKKKMSDEEFIKALFDPEWDKQMIKNSERKEGFEEGMMQGIEQGLEEGSLDKAIEIAKNMINKNIPLEDISEITGLSLEEIKELEQ
jgi:predicted transposase/invertase (TIGR01784 family)